MRAKPLFLACLAVGLFTQPAGAFVQVIGDGLAHDCFVAARFFGNVDQGIAVCSQALNLNDLSRRDRAATFDNRGVLLSAKGRTDDALADYDASLKLMPELGDAHVNRGAALIVLKRFDEALVEINSGLNLDMSYPYLGYYNRAVAEELMGKYTEAYYDYKRVLELEPNYKPASERLKFFTVTTIPSSG